MTRTKALADVHRRLAENAGPVVAARNLEVAALLDRLHAIERRMRDGQRALDAAGVNHTL